MQATDNTFFEEYKHLDKLCSEIYSCQNGVSEYIAQMEAKTFRGRYRIVSWDSDYNMLKHVRWVRNQIAHDSGDYQISEQEDVVFVKEFYDRIFSGQDPLSLLRKTLEAEEQQEAQQRKQQNTQTKSAVSPYTPPTYIPPAYTPSKKGRRTPLGFLIGLGVLAILFVLIALVSSQ